MVSQEFRAGQAGREDQEGLEKRGRWVPPDSLEFQAVMVFLEDQGCLAHLVPLASLERME